MTATFYDTTDSKAQRTPLGLRWTLTFYGKFDGVDKPVDAKDALDKADGTSGGFRPGHKFVPPPGILTPSGFGIYVVVSANARHAPNSNNAVDEVVWIYDVEIVEVGGPDWKDTEPDAVFETSVAVTNVQAFRIRPNFPIDAEDDETTTWLRWHADSTNGGTLSGYGDIGGNVVDWDTNPIQYALPIRTTTLSFLRPAQYWDNTTNVFAQGGLSDDDYVGARNFEDFGWIGGAGEVMLIGVNRTKVNEGTVRFSYTFRTHPWKHAVQVPRSVLGNVDDRTLTLNEFRSYAKTVWWSQPHTLVTQLKNELNITTDEWDAIGL